MKEQRRGTDCLRHCPADGSTTQEEIEVPSAGVQEQTKKAGKKSWMKRMRTTPKRKLLLKHHKAAHTTRHGGRVVRKPAYLKDHSISSKRNESWTDREMLQRVS